MESERFVANGARRQRITDAQRKRADLAIAPTDGAPERLELTLRLDTPAFLYGHHPRATKGDRGPPEMRLRSVTGVLRFWWRSLAWARALRSCGGNETAALKRVHDWQALIWGSEAGRFGQGAVTWSLTRWSEMEIGQPWSQQDMSQSSPGRVYMAGQGMNGAHPVAAGGKMFVEVSLRRGWPEIGRTETERDQIRGLADWSAWKPFEITARRSDRPSTPPTIADALLLLHLFGGVGSRSRRGFGGVAVETSALSGGDNSQLFFPLEAKATQDTMQVVLDAQADVNAPPPYTAFGSRTRLLLGGFKRSDASTSQAHERFGSAMQRFRGWGRKVPARGGYVVGNSVINGQSEVHSAVAASDHDNWYRGIANAAGQYPPVAPEDPVRAPQRAGFGLPMNSFSFKRDRQIHHENLGEMRREVGDQERDGAQFVQELSIGFPGGAGSQPNRRASPFILKVRSGKVTVTGIWLFMHAEFLPEEFHQLGALVESKFSLKRGKSVVARLRKSGRFTVRMPSPSNEDVDSLADAFFRDTKINQRLGLHVVFLSASKASAEAQQ